MKNENLPSPSTSTASGRPPVTELLKSIPALVGIRLDHQPEYQVLEKDGDIEIRQYEPFTVAQITVPGDFDHFREEAFKKLAGFIFGKNEESEKMAMTTPVFQEKHHLSNSWTMSFVMPPDFRENEIPQPLDHGIKFLTYPARTIATKRYTGNNTLEKIEENIHLLRAWLSAHAQYKPQEEIMAAQYDQPAVVPFLKRNEVLITLSSMQ